MDLRQLRYFVTVAEELNFSRAALRLHMSQPPLSHQIKALEDELGVVLLERNRRAVKLTPAGRDFLADSRALLDQAQVATQRARQSGIGQAGTLRVGMAPSAIDRVLPGFMTGMRAHLSLVQVVLIDMNSEEQVRSLAQDRLDLGFVHARVVAKVLERRPIYTEGLALVLPADHPLARRSDIDLRDLAEEPMVSFSREHRSALFDSLVAACMNAGFSPRLVHVARHPVSMFQMVRQGLGICIVPESFAALAGDGLSVIRLPATAGRIQIDAVWRAERAAGPLQRVLAHVLPGLVPS
jgi:DNA-binding transcriptional LysR family regulator